MQRQLKKIVSWMLCIGTAYCGESVSQAQKDMMQITSIRPYSSVISPAECSSSAQNATEESSNSYSQTPDKSTCAEEPELGDHLKKTKLWSTSQTDGSYHYYFKSSELVWFWVYLKPDVITFNIKKCQSCNSRIYHITREIQPNDNFTPQPSYIYRIWINSVCSQHRAASITEIITATFPSDKFNNGHIKMIIQWCYATSIPPPEDTKSLLAKAKVRNNASFLLLVNPTEMFLRVTKPHPSGPEESLDNCIGYKTLVNHIKSWFKGIYVLMFNDESKTSRDALKDPRSRGLFYYLLHPELDTYAIVCFTARKYVTLGQILPRLTNMYVDFSIIPNMLQRLVIWSPLNNKFQVDLTICPVLAKEVEINHGKWLRIAACLMKKPLENNDPTISSTLTITLSTYQSFDPKTLTIKIEPGRYIFNCCTQLSARSTSPTPELQAWVANRLIEIIIKSNQSTYKNWDVQIDNQSQLSQPAFVELLRRIHVSSPNGINQTPITSRPNHRIQNAHRTKLNPMPYSKSGRRCRPTAQNNIPSSTAP
ncbi:hypothetical protein NEHOM01_1545 [Nematocida homosporus]|uniref:uncharacterized protein n=1 Tax=Nematocida homosporus TaxID=1912981 RepID=UPI00222023C0|nr:uncharacterized protein NEHOM01_1545 [Nematocida homosporus]KAI5186559.1 hypothetical protein NEHOM01_1545 [Nematocida homosporus]